MKSILSLAALASSASAHYVLSSLTYNGATSAAWSNVRQWTNYYSNGPVTNVQSADIQCNAGASAPVAASQAVLSVTAGSTVKINVSPNIYHIGPSLVYLAKVPAGQSANTWTPSGNVWFKVAQYGVKSFTPALSFVTDGATSIDIPIPKSLPNGDYLARVEQIGLHVAQSEGAAQFYLSCAQLRVTGGGSGSPAPLVSFPGAYKATDPGLKINIYSPVPTSYTMPGPAVWQG